MDPVISIERLMDVQVIPLIVLFTIGFYEWSVFKILISCLRNERIEFFLMKHIFWIVFVLSSLVNVFMILQSNIHESKLENLFTGLENMIFNMFMGIFASSVFYLIQNWIPNIGWRKARREYVKGRMEEIYRILHKVIYNPFFFRKLSLNYTISLEEYIEYFIENYDYSNDGVCSYLELEESIDKIQEIVKELLSDYGSVLNFDQLKKLEFLKNGCCIMPLGIHAFVCDASGNPVYDSLFLKKQAVIVYKSFEVISKIRFCVPIYRFEKELEREIYLNYNI